MKKILIAIGVVLGVQQAQAQFRSNINAYYNYNINSNQGVYIRSNNDNYIPSGKGPENIRFQVGTDRGQSIHGGDFSNRFIAEINLRGLDLKTGREINFVDQAFSSINTSGRLTFIADSDNGGNSGAHANDDFRFKIGNSEKLVIQRDLTALRTKVEIQGRLGIGTNNPSEQLHVRNGNVFLDHVNGQYQSKGNLELRPDRSNSGDDSVIFKNSANEMIAKVQDGNLELHKGGRVSSSGNLVFRTNGANDRFEFRDRYNRELVRIQGGVIRTKDVLLNVTSFPDYVFADNYKLKPLNEVEEYINKNKHLPNMPSEKEVVANGMKVAQINTILVEKIEELTLYTIEQQKQIEVQNEKIALLLKKMQAIETAK